MRSNKAIIFILGVLQSLNLCPAFAGETSASTIPIAIKIAWHGNACDLEGTVDATVMNASDRNLKLPKVAGLGYSALFIARINTDGRTISSTGDNYSIPYNIDALRSSEILTLRPGKAHTYVMRLKNTPVMSNDSFSAAYVKFQHEGGRLGLIYSLNNSNEGGWDRRGFYYVDSELTPFITSNTLICPAD